MAAKKRSSGKKGAGTADAEAKAKPKRANRTKTYQINLWVSDLGRELLGKIADKHGLSLTHALEYMLRQQARIEGIWE